MKTDNELIAEFMGGDISTGWVTFQTPPSSLFQNYNWDVEDLAYHRSWDWLMPVVEKIESLGYFTVISNQNNDEPFKDQYCGVVSYQHNCHKKTTGETKLMAVYKMVIEFIKWYNENKSRLEAKTILQK